MKAWLSRKLHNLLYPPEQNLALAKSAAVESTGIDVDAGLRFTVMAARGVTIVQTSSYDRQKDRSDCTPHVIPEGEDIAVRVGEIVSMEMLRQ